MLGLWACPPHNARETQWELLNYTASVLFHSNHKKLDRHCWKQHTKRRWKLVIIFPTNMWMTKQRLWLDVEYSIKYLVKLWQQWMSVIIATMKGRKWKQMIRCGMFAVIGIAAYKQYHKCFECFSSMPNVNIIHDVYIHDQKWAWSEMYASAMKCKYHVSLKFSLRYGTASWV